MTQAAREQIVALSKTGATYAQIAAAVGATRSAVAGVLYRANSYTPRPFPVDPVTGKQVRGFAAMDPEKRLVLAIKGGASVPAHLRSFSQDRGLAALAGRKGGGASRGGGRPSMTLAAKV